jgi:ectoine hydroxylase-related dioxygenase (phytanoyl-CoA dioxygenase family)
LGISPRQIKEFKEQFFHLGYLVVPNFFDEAQISCIAHSLDDLYQYAQGLAETTIIEGTQFVFKEGVLQRVVWCEGMQKSLEQFSSDPGLLKIVSELLGSESIVQLLSQGHYKMPGDGVQFQWHQDSVHRRYGTELWDDLNQKGSFVQTLTVVDPMTKENGPLKILEGSCQLGHLTNPDSEQMVQLKRYFKEIEVVAEPGTLIFFHPFLIHSSSANSSESPRKVFINGYAYPHANKRIYPGSHLGKVLNL